MYEAERTECKISLERLCEFFLFVSINVEAFKSLRLVYSFQKNYRKYQSRIYLFFFFVLINLIRMQAFPSSTGNSQELHLRDLSAKTQPKKMNRKCRSSRWRC